MNDKMTTTAATKPSYVHDSVQCPEKVAERVVDVLLELHAENRHVKAQAIVEALGGERVWGIYYDGQPDDMTRSKKLAEDLGKIPGNTVVPALLIPLGESDG